MADETGGACEEDFMVSILLAILNCRAVSPELQSKRAMIPSNTNSP